MRYSKKCFNKCIRFLMPNMTRFMTDEDIGAMRIKMIDHVGMTFFMDNDRDSYLRGFAYQVVRDAVHDLDNYSSISFGTDDEDLMWELNDV